MIKIANRTREIRPSGMKRGACGNVGDGGIFFPPKAARAAFLSQPNLIQALVWNVGTCRPDTKGETQMGGPREGESTDAGHGDGPIRSSVEVPVMETR